LIDESSYYQNYNDLNDYLKSNQKNTPENDLDNDLKSEQVNGYRRKR
jgi:hypothetical protein